jgi:hypothetical protein
MITSLRDGAGRGYPTLRLAHRPSILSFPKPELKAYPLRGRLLFYSPNWSGSEDELGYLWWLNPRVTVAQFFA